jgi:hypothetical protein
MKEQFLALLQEELKLIDKFQEHLTFAHSLVDDDKVKAFFAHLVDEENEHKEDLEKLMGQVRALSSTAEHAQVVASPTHVSTSTSTETYGHYERRDQQVLTVGSLLGQKQ